MKKRTYKNEILFVVISTFIIVVIHVLSNIYNKSVTSTLDETLQYQTQPIPPSFDTKTINAIRLRNRVNPLYTVSSNNSSSESAEAVTPTITPVPVVEIASEEAILSP